MTILNKILKDKKTEVEQTLNRISKEECYRSSTDQRIPLDFKKSLADKPLSIIAEVKKASPSKGIIRSDFDPVSIATSYAKANTNCISILTESKYFLGDNSYLVDIKKEVACPLLRKDFIVDIRQIRESYELGADAILFIVSALLKDELIEYKTAADSFGLTCLVEVHEKEELDLALEIGFDLIGINNRNLKTFETNLNHSIELIKHIPKDIVTVSESGIKTPEDCLKLSDAGFNAILVGETLMRNPEPGEALKELMELVWN